MKKLVMLALLVALAVGLMFGWKAMKPSLDQSNKIAKTAAVNTRATIRLKIDGFFGYFYSNSPVFHHLLRTLGIVLDVDASSADTEARMASVVRGDTDAAAVTVDSDILYSWQKQFPGAIYFVIDESDGADAAYARKDSGITSIEDIKGKTGLRVALTTKSPSHHFAKAVKVHFGATGILPTGDLLIECNDSAEALQMLKDGKADIAIIWEPEVSRAEASKEYVKLIGTDETEGLIVDVKVFNNDFAAANREVVDDYIISYFRTMKVYAEDHDRFLKDAHEYSGLSSGQIEEMVDRIHWVDFRENVEKWYGLGQVGSALYDCIRKTVDILRANGDVSDNPLPGNDPWRIINSEFLQRIMERNEKQSLGMLEAGRAARSFPQLSDSEWKKMVPVGSIKNTQIDFISGSDELLPKGMQQVAEMAQTAGQYRFYILITGHTKRGRDKQRNLELSEDRAHRVGRWFINTHGIDPNRIKVVGKGATEPPKERPGESYNAYMDRHQRVEIWFMKRK